MTLTYCLRTAAEMLVLLPFYLILRKPWTCPNSRREWAMGCFVLFMVSLLTLALEGDWSSPSAMLQRAGERLTTGENISLTPFYTISTFFRHCTLEVFLVNIVGNVLMFLPWGFGCALLWRKNQNLTRIAALSLALTVFIETVQLFIGRHVDVDDLLLNFSGGMLGGGVWYALRWFLPRLDTFSE